MNIKHLLPIFAQKDRTPARGKGGENEIGKKHFHQSDKTKEPGSSKAHGNQPNDENLTEKPEKLLKTVAKELHSAGRHLGQIKENKHIRTPDLKANSRVAIDLKLGVKTLGEFGKISVSGHTNVRLNANSQGFALGLNQNLQTTTQLIFKDLPKPLQHALSKFTPQQIVSSLFLTAGIVAQIETHGLKNSETVQILKNLLTQIIGDKSHPPLKEPGTRTHKNNPTYYNNNPTHINNNHLTHPTRTLSNPMLINSTHSALTNQNTHLHSSGNNSKKNYVPVNDPILQIQRLVNKTRVVFEHCGRSTKIQDLQKIALIIAKSLEKGDVQTLAKLAEIVQKSQTQPESLSAKVDQLLQQLMSKGEGQAVKDAKSANQQILNQGVQPQTSGVVGLNAADKNVQLLPTRFADRQLLNESKIPPVKDALTIKEQPGTEKREFYNEENEAALRHQIDFNPHFAYDRQISSFEDSSDINLGKQELVNKHYSEIEDWLASGKHRFVKDFDFEKPIGMIVDRSESGYITAEKLRIVLVRDGSVNGWHFLRSFLVS